VSRLSTKHRKARKFRRLIQRLDREGYVSGLHLVSHDLLHDRRLAGLGYVHCVDRDAVMLPWVARGRRAFVEAALGAMNRYEQAVNRHFTKAFWSQEVKPLPEGFDVGSALEDAWNKLARERNP
jgi:hypothetical protein